MADPPHCGDIHIAVSSLGSDTTDWPSTHGQQTGRLERNGVASDCAGKACPGAYTASGSRTYDAYEFTNGTCFAACITVTLATSCAPPNDLFAVAYLGTFDPANICTGYLGDPGYSPHWGGSGAAVSFQFTLPAHQTAVLIVHEITPSAGCSSGYALDLSGVPCTVGALAVESASIVADICALGGGGNMDGYLDPGEKATISVIARNIGETGTTGISATLSSISPLVTVTDGDTTYPDIAWCASAPNDSPNFSFHLSVTAACGTTIPLTVHFTSNEGSWDSDFGLPVTPAHTITVLQEPFASWPPSGWSVVNGGGDCVWDSASAIGKSNGTGGSGDCADADSDHCGSGTAMNTSLVSPAMDLSNPNNASAALSFKSWFLFYASGNSGAVDVTTDGSTWTNLLTYNTANVGPNTESLDLTPYLGNSAVQIRFTYIAPDWEYLWEVDDILVTVTQTQTVSLVQEPFEIWPLSGWGISNGGGDCVWDSALTVIGRENLTGGAGDCADADSDACGSGTTMDTSLVSPVFDLSDSGFSTATLQYKMNFGYYYPGDVGDVDITTDGGANWTNLAKYTSTTYAISESVDLSPYLGHSSVQIGFHYVAPSWDYLWEVDDFLVTAKYSSQCASRTCTCPTVTPTITGDSIILCPSTSVALSTEAGKSHYRWYKNGYPTGTNSPNYTATGAGSYKVYYEEASGCSGISAGHVVTAEVAPAAPTGIAATPGCTGNSISWTDSPTALSHNVLRGITCGAATDTFADVTSPYNDTTAAAGTSYRYWVVGVNNCGAGANSTCVTATRLSAPVSPTGVAAMPGCTGNSVSWSASPGAASYDLLRGSTCGTVADTFSGVTSPYNDTSAVAGTTYQYWVVAANLCGTSPDSSCIAAVRPQPAPAAPTGVTSTPGCVANSISWTDSPTATSHNVVRGTTCGTAVTTFTGVTSPYSDSTAVAGTAYEYWVVGVNSCGTSTNSTCVTAVRLGEVVPEGWPDKSTLEWPSTPGATSYKVYRGVQSDLPNLLDGSVDSCTKYAGSLLSCTENDDPSSEVGRFYWYLVVGVSATCEGTAGDATDGVRIPNSSGDCP